MAIPAIFRNSAVYMLGNVANGLVPFLLLPVLTRYLAPAELGMVVSYQLLFSICAALSTLSLHGAVSVQYFKSGTERIGGFIASCLAIISVTGLIVVAGTAALAPWLEMFSLTPGWLVWCALSAALSGGASILLALWQSSEQPVPYVVFQFGQTVFNATLSLVLVVTFGAGAEGRLTGLALPVTVFGVCAIAWLLFGSRFRGTVSRQDIKVALRFGVPLVPHALAAIFIAQGDRVILSVQASLSETGIYAVAMQLLLPFIMVADAINRAFAPWIFRNLKEGNDADVAAGQLGLVGLYVAGSVAYLILVYFGLNYFLGENYQRAGDFFYLLIAGAVSASIYYAVVNPIFYAGRTELLTAVTLSSTVVYMAVGWWAAGVWGGRGLAVTYSVVSAIQTLAVFLVAQKVRPLAFAEGLNILRGRIIALARK